MAHYILPMRFQVYYKMSMVYINLFVAIGDILLL